jgi:hypothetical protein
LIHLDTLLLDAARAACVALPAAGVPHVLGRLRSRGWALVAPISIVVVLATGAHAATWTALLLVPPGCALALGWAAHGARPPLAVLAVPLLAAASVSEVARIVLIAGASVTAGRLLAGAAPLPVLKVAVVAMAVIDATFIFGHLADHQNAQFVAAVPVAGLPRLQIATLGRASCDFGDFFAAALVGAILARERRDQVLAAAAVFVATLIFDQLFLVVDELPATVPPAVVMLALDPSVRRWIVRSTDGWGRRRAARSMA